MILFCDSNGTIQKNLGSPVYQGSANSNIIYLIAPYAPSASVLAAFQLPDGTAIAPVAMTPQSSVPGVQNADGTTFAGWSYVLPGSVTAKYGTVSAQFYFYAPTGESSNPTSIIATASTSFQVGRGVTAILPDTPDADVYESILSNIAQLQTDLTSGYYAARAIYAWNSSYTYGSNEITFYPVGNYGAFVKSLVNRNTQQPYTSAGVLNSNWAEVANFNTIAEDFYAEIQTAVQQAQTAQAGAEAARAAAVASAENAQAAKNEAFVSAANAQKYLEDVNEARDQVSDYKDEVDTAIIYIRNMGLEIAQDVTNAENSASAAAQSAGQSAQSAIQAQEYAQQAQEYAQKHYEIVASYDALPQPGNSAYIYLVPSSTASGADNYEEYLWITNTSSYEFIGTTSDVNLSNYAQVNGTYSGMTVGAVLATQLTNQALNNLYGTEYWGKVYYAVGGNTVTNKPSGVNGFGLEILRGGSGTTIQRITATQDTTEESKAPNIYQRQYLENVWSEWEEIATSDGTYNGMTVGNAKNASSLGSIPAANYAQIDGSYAGLGAGHLQEIQIHTRSSDTVGWYKCGEFDISRNTGLGDLSCSVILQINGTNYGNYSESAINSAPSGQIEVDARITSGVFINKYSSVGIICGNITSTDFCICSSDDGKKMNLYVNISHKHRDFKITKISEAQENVPSPNIFEFTDEYYGTSAPSNAVYAVVRNKASEDSEGNDIATTYAKQTGTYSGMTVGNATNASQLGGYLASLYAKLASPAFTGTPTAPTAATSDNSTKIATTAFVQAVVGSGGGGSALYEHSFRFSHAFSATTNYVVSFSVTSHNQEPAETFQDIIDMCNALSTDVEIPASGGVYNTNTYPVVSVNLYLRSIFYFANAVKPQELSFYQASLGQVDAPLAPDYYSIKDLQDGSIIYLKSTPHTGGTTG